MHDVLLWVENSQFAVWLRESPSPFAYTGFLSLHAMGLAVAVGINAAVALRVLGFGRDIPMTALASLFRVMWVGFAVNAISGLGLLSTNMVQDLTSPTFYVKLLSIGMGAALAVRIRRASGTGDVTRGLAVASLATWALAITAGRLVEYPELFGFSK